MEIHDLEKRPLRSQPTRDRILAAAKSVFGREGYDRATIRAIAGEAKINPAMVMRYYGNKEGLFTAATDFNFLDRDFDGVPFERLGDVLARLLLREWGTPTHRDVYRAILLSALSHERSRAKFVPQYEQAYVQLVERYGTWANTSEVVALLLSQLIGVVSARYILRIPALVDMDEDALARVLGPALQASFDRLVPAARS